MKTPTRAFPAICRANVERETRRSAGILAGSQLSVALAAHLFKTAFPLAFPLFHCSFLLRVKIGFENGIFRIAHVSRNKIYFATKKRFSFYRLVSVSIIVNACFDFSKIFPLRTVLFLYNIEDNC